MEENKEENGRECQRQKLDEFQAKFEMNFGEFSPELLEPHRQSDFILFLLCLCLNREKDI